MTSFGSHVAISMDDACAWPYRTTEGVFSQAATMIDPYSWQCYSS